MYVQKICGINQTPLAYIYRKHVDVDSVIQAVPFFDRDHEYKHHFFLQGIAFNADSKKYYNILKPLLVGVTAWTFIRGYDKSSNERGGSCPYQSG